LVLWARSFQGCGRRPASATRGLMTGGPGSARDCVNGGIGTRATAPTFPSYLVAPLGTVFFGEAPMSEPLHRTGCRRNLPQAYQRWSPALGRWGLPTLTGLIGFAGLCGIAVCAGAGGGLYLKNSHVWTTEAIASIEGKPQVVNRSHKDDRLAPIAGPSSRSAGPQDGFGMLEVGSPVNATITIRDGNGRLVFELDPLRRRTVIAKREGHRVSSVKEPGQYMAPKSRALPVARPSNCDLSSCRTASITPQLDSFASLPEFPPRF
jgi:hypothetical protein